MGHFTNRRYKKKTYDKKNTLSCDVLSTFIPSKEVLDTAEVNMGGGLRGRSQLHIKLQSFHCLGWYSKDLQSMQTNLFEQIIVKQ